MVVYESMTTSLNDALKRQLVLIYTGMSKTKRMDYLTVVLQQKQEGGWDCGLFAIANAVCVTHTWNQNAPVLSL